MVKKESTKHKILQVSTDMFLEKGYTLTTVKMVCDELGISKGLFTFHFRSKDDVLAELVELLCKFQREMMEREAGEGISSLFSICLELMTMAAACEENDIAKEFFVSSYQSSKCLGIIHKSDMTRAKEVFAEYCPDWKEEQFHEAETLVAGIEYATLNAVDKTIPLETRISGALNTIMTIYKAQI